MTGFGEGPRHLPSDCLRSCKARLRVPLPDTPLLFTNAIGVCDQSARLVEVDIEFCPVFAALPRDHKFMIRWNLNIHPSKESEMVIAQLNKVYKVAHYRLLERVFDFSWGVVVPIDIAT